MGESAALRVNLTNEEKELLLNSLLIAEAKYFADRDGIKLNEMVKLRTKIRRLLNG